MDNIKYTYNNKLFFIGLLTKIIIIFVFSSQVLNELFVPFISYFTDTFSNPYEYFLSIGSPESFPYPAVMLYILSLAKIILFFLSPAIAIKFALLFADFIIYTILIKVLPKYRKEVLLFYWLSPVLIYINYIHGQLDVIPVTMLFISLYLLFKRKYYISLIVLGLSVAAKTSMVIVVPFVLVYLFFLTSCGFKNVVIYGLISVVSFLAVNIFFLHSEAFYQIVFHNSAQNAIFVGTLKLGEYSIYLAILFYIILLFQAVFLKIRSSEIFILFICFSFGIILIFIPPTPGWYYWIIPFWIYFYASSSFRGKLLFLALQLLFFAYFAIIPSSDYLLVLPNFIKNIIPYSSIYDFGMNLGLNMNTLINISLTLLQAVLILNVYWIYRRGLDKYAQYKIISKPMLIGIGGNSGVGKSTIAKALTSLFSESNITNIKGDDLHKWERGDENWQKFTHLDPRANELHQEYIYLRNLKFERNLNRRHYDHATGKFIYPKDSIKAKRVILYDGLHPFYLKKVRDLFDIKIFVQPDKNLATYWKITRDTKKRGYSKEKVLEQINARQADYDKYIKPQENEADIIISVMPVTPIEDILSVTEEPDTWYHIKCKNSVFIEPLVKMLSSVEELKVTHTYDSDDFQSLSIYGTPLISDIEKFGKSLEISKLGIESPVWLDRNDGITQIFILYYIFEVISEHRSY